MITDLAKDYLAGVAGGVAVVLIGHPFDTVKTRLQTSPSGVYAGTIDCLKQTMQAEGMKGFYAGIGAFQLETSSSSFLPLSCRMKNSLLLTVSLTLQLSFCECIISQNRLYMGKCSLEPQVSRLFFAP